MEGRHELAAKGLNDYEETFGLSMARSKTFAYPKVSSWLGLGPLPSRVKIVRIVAQEGLGYA